MTTFLGKLSKNGLLYGSVGLFIIAMSYVLAPTSVNAALDTSSLWSQGVWDTRNGLPISANTPQFQRTRGPAGLYTVYFKVNGVIVCSFGGGALDNSSTFSVNNPPCDPTNISQFPYDATIEISDGMNSGYFSWSSSPDQGWLGVSSEDDHTRFISLLPENGTTTATTTNVGAKVYANAADFPNYGRVHAHFTQDSAFACQNSGAVYDAVVTCAGVNAPASPINIDFSTTTLDRLISGEYDLSQTITFGGGGKWTGVFTIDQVSQPWYYLGLSNSYNTLLTQTTHFIVGLPSPMDIVRQAVASSSAAFASTTRSGIGAILASTTASLINACNPFGGFNPGDCLTLTIWPGEQAIADDFTIIKQTPPWGYVFRVVDLLNATTSTTTLPTIDYSFASTSPMAVVGNIHFDPFGSVAQAGALIGEMHSDQAGAPTVWTIMMPIVNIFVYLVLAFMIIHDLTGIHWGGDKKHDDSKD